ncbi:MAG: hypothetical protein M1609_05245 [Firmicutes bacterium]|nr:hypothetical protein [Bacillota bacterium]MCL5057661.1 hypothetical protein [Actinomycetota bacterium]
MINSALMRWTMRRYAMVYWIILAFLLGGLAFLFLILSPGSVITTEVHPFFSSSILLAMFWGAGIYNREYRNGNLLEFMMVRPVSREEFFNNMLLAGAIPLILLMFLPFVYVMALNPWFDFSLPPVTLFYVCLLAAVWVEVVFLAGINVGLFLIAHSAGRYGRYLLVFAIAAMTAVFINLNNLARNGPANPVWQVQNHPWISTSIALAAAAALYYTGRRRMKRMNI